MPNSPNSNPLQVRQYPSVIDNDWFRHLEKRRAFIDLIYKEIELRIPTMSANEIDMMRGRKTPSDITRAKDIISYFVFEVRGSFILISPETRKPSYMLNVAGGLIKFSLDEFKWDIGVAISRDARSAGNALRAIADLAESRNRLNPRFDKWYRNPLVIKRNRKIGSILSRTGNTAFKVFKFLGSTPVTIFQMVIAPQTAGPVPNTEEELEDAVVKALIDLCIESKINNR